MENLKFEDMNISEEICKAVKDMGFEEATPIQSEAISVIMAGRDVIGQSQTGTGKTAAFGIPCLEMIDVNDRKLQAVILCPTRELAIQVCEEFRRLIKYKNDIRILPIYGGQPIDRQILALKKGVQVIIGTPGRVMDHMRRRTLKMETVKMVILDEADEMLDMGFREDIEEILTKVTSEHQTVLFSATMAKEILDLTRKFQNDPHLIKVTRKELTIPNTEQIYFELKERDKLDATSRLIDLYNPKLSIIFCNTKRRVDEVVEQLQVRGYFAEGLHGDLKQQQRDRVMQKFRNGTIEILVATDVAARGIDVDDVDIVFNYDVPQDEEYYVHRIGRTGRAGRSGRAFTFIVGKEMYKLRDIMKYTKAKIALQKLPSISDIEEVKTGLFLEKLKGIINQGHLTKYINIVEEMVSDDYATIDIASGLLKMSLGEVNPIDTDLAKAYSSKSSNSNRDRDSYSSNSSNRDSYSNRNKDRDRDTTSSTNREEFTEDTGASEEGMARLFINVGRKDKISPKDVLGAIAGETGIPGKLIGTIDIYDNYTFVEVPKEHANQVLEIMKNNQIKGNKINIEAAKGKNNR